MGMGTTCFAPKGSSNVLAGGLQGTGRKRSSPRSWVCPPQPYLVKELQRSPMKAMVAPMAAVVLQPILSVKMLTMGEQKKIIPMAREPTHAGEREQEGDGQGGTSNRGSGESTKCSFEGIWAERQPQHTIN